MGRRGPKSVVELATLRSRRRRSAYDDDPSTRQPPPDHLSTATKAWWGEVVERRGFDPHQYRVLQCAAESWDRMEQARQELKQHGLSYTDARGMVRARPEVAIERDSRIAFVRCLRELRLDDVEPPVQLEPRAFFEHG